ncbi:MAG TPA: DsbA family oxidoreductase [Dermatophilaceae bacterium]|nr:DsbA family oxidoreductase [Dermatophilaceae bacterium]
MGEIVLDVWADVVCPWCYMAKRRLEAAISRSERPADVTVTYHAFELDPTTPVGTGESMLAHLARAHGSSAAEAREVAERAAIAARPDRIVMDIDALTRANTFDAHRLVALGLAMGGPALQGAVLERFYAGVFAEGRALDDHAVLQRLGAEAGLDERRVSAVLAGEEYGDHVRTDERDAAELGVTGVPFTVADRRLSVHGAVPVETLVELIAAVSAPARP